MGLLSKSIAKKNQNASKAIEQNASEAIKKRERKIERNTSKKIDIKNYLDNLIQ